MNEHRLPNWLAWAREIQSMCQTGLAFSKTEYETLRYKRLLEIAAEMVESPTGISAGELVENFTAQPGYATVKVDVRGAVVRDSMILLVQEKADRKWSMPGGWADVGEHPSRMVSREVFEESGLIVNPKKVVGIYDADRAPVHLDFYHAYKIIFLCEDQAGEPRPGDETMAAGFFSFAHLPPLSGYRTTERHLEDVLAHLNDPRHLTVFD
jgi:ADP-ribose pyrophosphatase YjhB (NUDIX family)